MKTIMSLLITGFYAIYILFTIYLKMYDKASLLISSAIYVLSFLCALISQDKEIIYHHSIIYKKKGGISNILNIIIILLFIPLFLGLFDISKIFSGIEQNIFFIKSIIALLLYCVFVTLVYTILRKIIKQDQPYGLHHYLDIACINQPTSCQHTKRKIFLKFSILFLVLLIINILGLIFHDYFFNKLSIFILFGFLYGYDCSIMCIIIKKNIEK